MTRRAILSVIRSSATDARLSNPAIVGIPFSSLFVPPRKTALRFARHFPPNLAGRLIFSHRADPFDLAETLADHAVAIELSDLSVVTCNPRIEFGQLFPQLCHQRANQGIENAVLIFANYPCESAPEIADVFCNDDAV